MKIIKKSIPVSVVGLFWLEVIMAFVGIVRPNGNIHWTDEGFFYHLAHKIYTWGDPFSLSVFQPGNGLSNIYVPVNIWTNPGYLLIASLPNYLGPLCAHLYFVGILYLSFIFLIRVLELPMKSGVLFSVILILLFNKPFFVQTKLFSPFDNNPALFQTIAIANLILGMFFLLGKKNKQTNILLFILLPIITCFLLWSDPLWCVLVIPPLFVFGATFFNLTFKENVWKFSCIILSLVCLIKLNYFDYLISMQAYMSRRIFSHEIYGDLQDATYACSFFHMGQAKYIFRALLFVNLIGCFVQNKNARRLALGSVFSLLLLVALSLYFVFKAGNWTMPLPVYFEGGFLFLWFLSAFQVLLGLNFGKFTVDFLKTREGKFVALIPIFWFMSVINASVAPPASDTSEITKYLQRQIAISPGSKFNGLVASHFAVNEDIPHNKFLDLSVEFGNYKFYKNPHFLGGLWFYDIPTLEEYNQIQTPFLHILTTRLLSRDYDYFSRNYLFTTKINVKILQMLGVRFIISDKDIANENIKEVIRLSNPDADHDLYLFEIANPNIISYYPINIVFADSSYEAIEALSRDNFDPKSTVVLFDSLQLHLVKAESSQLFYFKNHLHFSGSSKGTSIALLPVQFSHCMVSNNQNVKLLRANIAQTAVVFSGNQSVDVEYKFDIKNTLCRKADVEDVAKYKLKDMEENLIPSVLIPHKMLGDYGSQIWRKRNTCEAL